MTETPNGDPTPAAPTFPEPKYSAATPHDFLLQFFAYAHLKPDLQEISRPFGEMAAWLQRTLPYNPERTVALRKLLEAKDCAVRAKLAKN